MYKSHVAMGLWPTQEDWLKASDLLKTRTQGLEKQSDSTKEFGFFEFMFCVLFILERVGVKSLINANDLMNCLENLYNENKLFYPSAVFRNAWEDIFENKDEEFSPAQKFFNHLKKIQMIRFIYGRENVLVFCTSDYASSEAKTYFYENLDSACRILKNSQYCDKYIAQISFVAKDLLMVMHKGDLGNEW